MGRKLAYDLFIRDDFLIYDRAHGTDRFVVPLSGIDAVVLWQPNPDMAILMVRAGGDEIFRCDYDVKTAENIQRTLVKLLKPDATQSSLGL
jgi:hypothetical protein